MNITLNLPEGPFVLPIEDLAYVDADTLGISQGAEDDLTGEDFLKTLSAGFTLGGFSGIIQKQAPLLGALASAESDDLRVAMLTWAENLNMTNLTGDQHNVTRAFKEALVTMTGDLSDYGASRAASEGITLSGNFKQFVNWQAYLNTKNDLLIQELPSGRYAVINANA